MTMRRFRLNRHEDESGISGTGIVAEGVQFSDGKCVITWLLKCTSVAIYDCIDDIETIHGHLGKTTIEWIDND